MSKCRWRLGVIGLPGLFVTALCVGARAASAEGVTAALLPDPQTVALGAEFTVELRVTQPGSPFNGFDARVSYDPSALTFVPTSPTSLQQGSLMTNACGNTFHRFLAGAGVDTITDVLLCAGTSVTTPGQLYKLRFRASNTPQITRVNCVPGTLKFYNAGLFVTPVMSSDAIIGIGVSRTAVGGAPGPKGLVLAATPNPARGSVAFTTHWQTTGPESLTVRDVQGRIVRVMALAGHKVAWNGRLDSGESAANGVYFATLHADGHTTTIRFSLLRTGPGGGG